MFDIRAVLAAGLGIGLGALLLAYPGAVLRVYTVGRVPHDRGGTYGTDPSPSDRWRWIIRAVGVGTIAVGVYVGATAVGP